MLNRKGQKYHRQDAWQNSQKLLERRARKKSKFVRIRTSMRLRTHQKGKTNSPTFERHLRSLTRKEFGKIIFRKFYLLKSWQLVGDIRPPCIEKITPPLPHLDIYPLYRKWYIYIRCVLGGGFKNCCIFVKGRSLFGGRNKNHRNSKPSQVLIKSIDLRKFKQKCFANGYVIGHCEKRNRITNGVAENRTE